MPAVVGNDPNQVPTNADLGPLAFRDENPVGDVVGTSDVQTLTNKTLTGGTVNPTVLQEGSSPAVVQSDVGREPNQIPLNQFLGAMAFRDESPAGAIVGTSAVQVLSGKSFSGNVGIGTASPIAILNTYQVNGGGESAAIFQNFSTTTNTAVALYLSPTNGTLTSGAIRASFIKAINTGGGVTALTFGTNASGADPVERMRLDSSGNLLVGRTNQSSGGKLEVGGNVVCQPSVAAPTLGTNGDMSFQLVSDTSLKILVRGSDGVTRSTTLTLA